MYLLNTFPAFPKIFHFGSVGTENILSGEYEITEKIDGSQFAFCNIGDELRMRTKGQEIYPGSEQKMFTQAVKYVQEINKSLNPEYIYYCEYLSKPKHNVLKYDRTPLNNLMCFAIYNPEKKYYLNRIDLEHECSVLGIEPIPLMFKAINIEKLNLEELLNQTSVLGNEQIEGFVIKNYKESFLIGGQHIYPACCKYVSEKFKERHHSKDESIKYDKKSDIDLFIESFRTTARWNKAIQHLRDSGKLISSPKDIGGLIKEIHKDILEEEIENIKDGLYKIFKDKILRKSVAGFPEFYKKYLIYNQYGVTDEYYEVSDEETK